MNRFGIIDHTDVEARAYVLDVVRPIIQNDLHKYINKGDLFHRETAICYDALLTIDLINGGWL